MKKPRYIAAPSVLVMACALVGCSDSASATGTLSPSGVFVRTDAQANTKIWLAFDNGNGARWQESSGPAGTITEQTCFTYDQGTSVKLTLQKKVVSNGSVSTTQDLSNRIVEPRAVMSADGAKLDAEDVLEKGRFEYVRDSAKAVAELRDGC